MMKKLINRIAPFISPFFTNITFPNYLIFIFIVSFSCLCAPCKAEQLAQTNHQKSILQERSSPKPHYMIAMEKGDYKAALKEMRPLAEKGDVLAQYSLSVLYYKGIGVPQSYQESIKWTRKAAEQNMVIAQYNLGKFYNDGIGVVQDYREAAKWYLKAAERGEPLAQRNIGILYDNGWGVSQNYKEAIKWYSKAAEQDQSCMKFYVSAIHDGNKCVPQNDCYNNDDCRLMQKYRIDAITRAQMGIGIMYLKGHGVAKDYVQAYKWFYIAADKGETIAKDAISMLSKCMKQNQIDEAKRLAKEEMITKK